MLGKACQMIVQSVMKDETRYYGAEILRFLDSAGILADPAVLSDIAQALMKAMHAVAVGTGMGDKQQMVIACYDAFARVCPALPKIVRTKINESFAQMSKGRKAIARYINKETDRAAFMTALAKRMDG